MQIESISAQADRAGRYLIKFSDGSTMRLYRQTVEDFGLFTGRELTPAEMTALREAAGQMSAKMRAVRIVAASNVSVNDLEQRLIHKGETPRQAKEAVQWMTELNLLDDTRTAQLLVQQCARKGYGKERAKQMLYEKRIPKSLWEEALADYPDMTEQMVDFLRSRLPEDADAKDVKRAVDALLRRGHSYSQIRNALSRLQMDDNEFPEEL